MSHNSNNRSSWLNIPKDDTPGPGQYNPNQPETRIVPTFRGRNELTFETPGPGPGAYSLQTDNNGIGTRWASSSRRSSIPINSTIANNTNIPEGIAVLGQSLLTVEPQFEGIEGSIFCEGQFQSNSLPSEASNYFEGNGCGQDNSNEEITKEAKTYCEGSKINEDKTIATPNVISLDNELNNSESGTSNNKTTPTNNGLILANANGERQPHPIIFVATTIHKKPFPWLTDGRLSIFGVNCAICLTLQGIVHLWIYHHSAGCLTAGIWMLIWGLCILPVEGMRLPKITFFNRHLEFLYPFTNLLNRQAYWIKTVVYAIIGTISIAICAKWTTGFGGGAFLILGIFYGLKQIDQNYAERQMEFQGLQRAHLSVRTIS